jgi:hypothetical protein
MTDRYYGSRFFNREDIQAAALSEQEANEFRRTVSQGDITVTLESGESIAIGHAIIETVTRYRARRALLEGLKDIKHGHVFGDDRVCKCGMQDTEYFATRDQLTVCPMAKTDTHVRSRLSVNHDMETV